MTFICGREVVKMRYKDLIWKSKAYESLFSMVYYILFHSRMFKIHFFQKRHNLMVREHFAYARFRRFMSLFIIVLYTNPRTLKGPLLTHQFSSGGRSKHTTLSICNPSPLTLYELFSRTFVIVYFPPTTVQNVRQLKSLFLLLLWFDSAM